MKKLLIIMLSFICFLQTGNSSQLNPNFPIGLVYQGHERVKLLTTLSSFRENYKGPTDIYNLEQFSCIVSIIGTNGDDHIGGIDGVKRRLEEAIENIRLGDTVVIKYIPKWIDSLEWRKRIGMDDCYARISVFAPSAPEIGEAIGAIIGGITGMAADPWTATLGGALGAVVGGKISRMSTQCIWDHKETGLQLQ